MLETLLALGAWAAANWLNVLLAVGVVLVALVALLRAVAALLLLVPGDQKESLILSIADKVQGAAAWLTGLKKP